MVTYGIKAAEERLQRLARWRGFVLLLDPVDSVDLGHMGEYMLIDARRSEVVAGKNFDLSLEEAEERLTSDEWPERRLQA